MKSVSRPEPSLGIAEPDWIARRRDSAPEGQVKHRRLLDVQRRITQERVPTASNVGSRDVTLAALRLRYR